jgi:hypothetical protein
VKEQSVEINGMSEIKDALLDLKFRSMKQNLVFMGLRGETMSEDTESILRQRLPIMK